MRDDFAVFILSHGRPDNIKTLRSLEKGNYTGKIYIIIDNEDETADEYYRRYGDKIVQFDKLEAAKNTDPVIPSSKRNSVVYARNECWRIAKELGLTHFLVLDDDYTIFHFRFITNTILGHVNCKQLDRLFESMCAFLEVSGASTVTFSQGGDFIGGRHNKIIHKELTRKAMNTFFCMTDRPFKYIGMLNDDVNTYCLHGSQGELFFTVMAASIEQMPTQKNRGGLTEIYLESGTYVKSFCTVMLCPSCVKVTKMGETHKRIHHRVDWNHCVPKILSEKWKKTSVI